MNTKNKNTGMEHAQQHMHYHKQDAASWTMALMSLLLMVLCTGYLFSEIWKKDTPQRIILCGSEMVTPDKDFYIP